MSSKRFRKLPEKTRDLNADTVDKLQDLNKKLKDLKELPKTANANIKNALFVGSTAELQRMLKKDEVIEGKADTPKKDDISDK